MSVPPHVFDGTRENFSELVMQNSAKGPVLVNYWAPFAGPCLKLYPTLEGLVRQYGGRFLLVNVNTKDQPLLAREQGVTSLPTLKLYRGGQVAETLHGVPSESELRKMLDRFLGRESDASLVAALRKYQDGEVNTALHLLAQAAVEDPDNLNIPLTLAKLLVRESRAPEAHLLLTALPGEARREPRIGALLAHLGFVLAAQEAPEPTILERTLREQPENLEARYQLAAVLLSRDDYEPAMEHLLAILKQDRSFRDEAGLRGLLAVFDLLGSGDALAERFRRRLLNILH